MWNYAQARNSKSSQHLVHLGQLLIRDRFKQIASFLYVVMASEESQLSQHWLKKILPFREDVKWKCLDHYQPLQRLSVDEQMVKSVHTSDSTSRTSLSNGVIVFGVYDLPDGSS